MRAAKPKERPSFSLMKQTDIQNIYYMQMPRWLFSDPRYAGMTLDAKVAYTFLLNRFQLSRRKGWVNDQGEVFVIFPRLALARELRICEKRVTAAFRALAERRLIWEVRCGRGDANQIYLARVEPVDDPGYQCAPFLSDEGEEGGFRTADMAGLDAVPDPAEPRDWRAQNGGNGGSEAAETAVLEPRDPPPSKKEKRKKELREKEVSQSVTPPLPAGAAWGGQADAEEEELLDILDACELDCFDPETARVFENAVERLFYSDSFRIGNATLPKSRIRAKLRLLDGMVLRSAENKLAANLEREVRNSTAYTMAAILNCIAESESDLMVDPYLNSLRAAPPRAACPAPPAQVRREAAPPRLRSPSEPLGRAPAGSAEGR